MSGGFVKIYGSILRSSVWQQPVAIKIVWITMLALADENGLVESSIPGLAATAGVTIGECEAALACFLAPDPYSGSEVDEGRRIRACRGGWVIINHRYYRELRTERQVREAERLAAKRTRAKSPGSCNPLLTVQHVGNVADVAPNAEANTEEEISSSSPPATNDAPSARDDAGPEASRKAVKSVFECWQAEHGKGQSKLDGKRTARIKARLSEGFTVQQLCQALRGAKKDRFLMGREPRSQRVFDGIETLLRDAAQVERLMKLDGEGPDSLAAATEEGNWLV